MHLKAPDDCPYPQYTSCNLLLVWLVRYTVHGKDTYEPVKIIFMIV
jgi:hypothetical protein